MLLIDGVKYELWTPPSEDEFERVVKEHTQEIFGEQSIYLDRKQKLKSLSGIGSIPDGYVIIFGDAPHWHIVEVELSWHPLHDHIVSQVSRFISGIRNPSTQRNIVDAIDGEIAKDDFLKLRLKKAVEPTEIYRFLSDLVSKQPILTIIIEKDTEELREALSTLRYPQIKVVEFQTFTREGIGLAVHAHLFEPLCEGEKRDSRGGNGQKGTTQGESGEKKDANDKKKRRIPGTVKDLIDAQILKVNQVIYRWYRGKKYEARILHDGKIKLLHDDSEHNSLSTAAKGIAGSVDGWEWWYTTIENGRECKLDELRKEYNSNLSSSPSR